MLFSMCCMFHFGLMVLFTYWICERPLQFVNMTSFDDIGQVLKDSFAAKNITPRNDEFYGGSMTDTASFLIELLIDGATLLMLIMEVLDSVVSLLNYIQYHLRRAQTGYYMAPWSVIFR